MESVEGSTSVSDGHGSNHGSTPAAWTLVVLITLGFIVSTTGLVIGQWPVFWVGVGIVVLGAVVGKVMQAAGLGATKRERSSSHS